MERLARSPHQPARAFSAVATALGIFSTLAGVQLRLALHRAAARRSTILLALNVTYWYAWAVLVPGMLWMARRYRFGRHTWQRAAAMHARRRAACSRCAHAVLTVTAARLHHAGASTGRDARLVAGRSSELFFLNFDWEMMTYWAIVGLSHALDFHRESQERALTAAQLADAAGRGAAAGAAAAAAPALPVQHAAHDLGADAPRHRRRRRDAGAAQRPAAADARPHRHAAGAAQGGARLPRTSISRSSGPASAIACSVRRRRRARHARRRRCRTCCCSRWSRTPSATASRPKLGGGTRRDRRAGATATTCALIVRDNGAGLPADDAERAQHRRRPEQHALAAASISTATAHRFEFHAPAGGGLAVTIVIPFVGRPGRAAGRSPMESVA